MMKMTTNSHMHNIVLSSPYTESVSNDGVTHENKFLQFLGSPILTGSMQQLQRSV